MTEFVWLRDFNFKTIFNLLHSYYFLSEIEQMEETSK